MKRYGPSKFAIHDQGTEFHNKLAKQLWDMNGVKVNISRLQTIPKEMVKPNDERRRLSKNCVKC